jgi:hypothetical protein
VLGYGRLRDPELRPDDPSDGACGLFAVGEQLQYPAPHRVTKHVKGMHGSKSII